MKKTMKFIMLISNNKINVCSITYEQENNWDMNELLWFKFDFEQINNLQQFQNLYEEYKEKHYRDESFLWISFHNLKIKLSRDSFWQKMIFNLQQINSWDDVYIKNSLWYNIWIYSWKKDDQIYEFKNNDTILAEFDFNSWYLIPLISNLNVINNWQLKNYNEKQWIKNKDKFFSSKENSLRKKNKKKLKKNINFDEKTAKLNAEFDEKSAKLWEEIEEMENENLKETKQKYNNFVVEDWELITSKDWKWYETNDWELTYIKNRNWNETLDYIINRNWNWNETLEKKPKKNWSLFTKLTNIFKKAWKKFILTIIDSENNINKKDIFFENYKKQLNQKSYLSPLNQNSHLNSLKQKAYSNSQKYVVEFINERFTIRNTKNDTAFWTNYKFKTDENTLNKALSRYDWKNPIKYLRSQWF